MFSTVVELMMLVSLGLRPSLHAAARQMDNLPVSLASLYDKVNHTEAGILQALVQGSAQRLAPVMARMGVQPGLAGYELRVLDGHHLPGSEKRLAVLRGHRGAALPYGMHTSLERQPVLSVEMIFRTAPAEPG